VGFIIDIKKIFLHQIIATTNVKMDIFYIG